MNFHALTIFPEMFEALTRSRIVQRSLESKLFTLQLHDLRTFAEDKHRTVDDVPFGGGAGMIMKPEPIAKAIESVTAPLTSKVRRIYLSPKGRLWNQNEAQRLLSYDHVVLLCGRYQGVDQRLIDGWIDEEISVGPYILAGGELPAMIVMESMIRLIPGVLGNEASLQGETHGQEDPEYPQYTRPRDFRGAVVPEVLLSGNHADIEKWRAQAAKNYKPKFSK